MMEPSRHADRKPPQRTIAADTEVRGVGFFHGHDVTLRFRPAAADTGVVFVRTDLPGRPAVRAHVNFVVPTPRRTSLRHGEAVVEMVEHVMAALAGLQVDNCRVELDAPEPPGCDGSSLAFTEALAGVGFVTQDRPRAVLAVDRLVTVREGQAELVATPATGLTVAYALDYGPESPIRRQEVTVDVTPESFVAELASTRTFLLETEAHVLRQNGIGARVTDADLLIFGADGVTGNTLRHPDECARHKALDLVGDLALLGMDLHGRVHAVRSGHALNAALVRALIAAADSGRTAA